MLCDLAILIGDALRVRRHRLLITRYELSANQYLLLHILAASGGTLTQSRAIELMNLVPSTVTNLAHALVDRELITRSHPPRDRRSIILDLTAAGRALYVVVAQEIGELEAAVLVQLEAAAPVLHRLADYLGVVPGREGACSDE